jgi:Peptidase MA superfamily
LGCEVHRQFRSFKVLLLSFAFLFILPDPSRSQTFRLLKKQDLAIMYEESLSGGAEEAARLYPEAKRDVEARLGLKVVFMPSILLIKNSQAFQRIAGSSLVVAFAVPQENLMVIDHSRMNADPFSIEVTMKHELCHLLLHVYLGNRKIPRWFEEGIAQWVSEGISEIVLDQKKPQLNEAVLAGKIIPMKNLSQFFPGEREALVLAYEQSQSLVSYIIDTYGRESILSILRATKEGRDWEEAVRDSLGISYVDLEHGWLEHIKKRLTWFTYVANNLYQILFFLAAVASVVGFVRAYLRKRAYMREEGGEDFHDPNVS